VGNCHQPHPEDAKDQGAPGPLILGTIARKVSPRFSGHSTRQRLKGEKADEAKEHRLLKWALQAEARAMLPNERVAQCLRQINPMAAGVEGLHSPEHQVAHYKSLIVCGSVWMCPLCAAKISERRRDELERAITHHTAPLHLFLSPEEKSGNPTLSTPKKGLASIPRSKDQGFTLGLVKRS